MSKVPAIRFKGFDDAWEQRKLGDVVAEFYCGKTPYRQNESYWNGMVNWLASGDLNRGLVLETAEKISEHGREETGLRVVPKGTVVIATMGQEAPLTRGNCGFLGIDSTINQACIAFFVDKDVVDNDFLFQWYKMVGNAYGLRYTQGTKQQNYNAETLGKLDIALPGIDEQRSLGTLLSSLDNLITLHQRKCDKLVVLKKALLDKMFPRDGSNTPEIRFAGFTDPWEQRKLGEVAPLQRGFDLPVGLMEPGPYPVVMSNGVGGWHSRYMVKGPGVVTGRSGTIGGLQYVEQDYWPHNTSLWVTSFNENEPKFIYWLYRSIGLERFGSGSGVPTLNRNDVHDQAVGIPCDIDEQRQIAVCLDHLDTLITLHQRKLEALRNLKSALLQKMFV